jgi:hypothetical protein
MRIITPLIVAAIFLAAPARAEDEDQRSLCPVMSDMLITKVAAFVKGKGHCPASCTGCGCQGGPGFCGADGHCVGWANIGTKCGSAPHSGCRRECTPVITACAGHALGRAWLKAFAASARLAVTFVPPDPPADGANIVSPLTEQRTEIFK